MDSILKNVGGLAPSFLLERMTVCILVFSICRVYVTVYVPVVYVCVCVCARARNRIEDAL